MLQCLDCKKLQSKQGRNILLKSELKRNIELDVGHGQLQERRGQSCGGVQRPSPCSSSAAVAAKVGNQFSGASLVNCALGLVTDRREPKTATVRAALSATNYRCYWSLKCRGDTPICISIMHCQSPREHFSFFFACDSHSVNLPAF